MPAQPSPPTSRPRQRDRAAPPTINLTDTLVFSTGCHAGYNAVDGDGIAGVTQTLDWAQVLARKGATLVAGTGFQYGDDELVEYSERIYAEFAHQLRVGNGPVSVGLGTGEVQARLPRGDAEPKGMHQKALLTATVFGLPMFAVNMTGTRDLTGAAGSIVDGTNEDLGVTRRRPLELDFNDSPPKCPAPRPTTSGDRRRRLEPGRTGAARATSTMSTSRAESFAASGSVAATSPTRAR